MSTRKRRDPRGLEPESPSLYADEKASKQSPPSNIVDEVIARFIVTAAPLLIARLFPPSPAPAAARAETEADRDTVWRTCQGNKPLCGARGTLASWTFCPYCGTELRRVQ